MTCDETKPMLPEYWSQSLSAAQQLELGAHLESCESCRGEAERLGALWRSLGAIEARERPSDALSSRFYESLAAYREGSASVAASGSRWSPAGRVAAGVAAGLALLLGGIALGDSWHRGQAASAEITQLRGEVGTMRQLVALSLLQQQSASERLRGVSWAYQVEPPDSAVLTALITAVNHDPNVNVRLAAVDALRPFASNAATRPAAREAAVQSLSLQREPLVQVALIDLLADLKERSSAPALRSLASDVSTDAGVRERAHMALENLQ